MNKQVLGWTASILVLGAVVAAFASVGSPSRQRAIRFDQERVNHLQQIQNEIHNYWSRTNKLPVKLADLSSGIGGFVAPVDPETNTSYEYRTTGELSFELCATFKLSFTESDKDASRALYYPAKTGDWNHAAGRVCYSRNINPVLDKSPLPNF